MRHFFSTLASEPKQSLAIIVEKTAVNHDCYLYKLKLEDNPFSLGIGQHFRIVETIKTYDNPEGEEIVRKYTPINSCSQQVLPALGRIPLMCSSRSTDLTPTCSSPTEENSPPSLRSSTWVISCTWKGPSASSPMRREATSHWVGVSLFRRGEKAIQEDLLHGGRQWNHSLLSGHQGDRRHAQRGH